MQANRVQPLHNHSLWRKAKRIMLPVISVLVVLVLVFVVVSLVMSPGKPLPIVDANGKVVPGSISEKVFLNIGGVRQGLFIQSRDPSNPVLLYLHGGMPDYFLTERYPTGLEDYFTIVWWEQRGSGLSYSPDLPRETLNLEQMLSDTFEVTNYLRQRFGKDKVYLMGHSGGTFVGIHAAQRAPELYYAYIGVAQMSNQLKSENEAYQYMVEKFRENGDTGMLRKLEAAPVTLTGGTPDAYLALRDTAMHSLGVGTMHNMNSVITGIFLPSLASPQYTLKEKLNTWLGKSRSGVSALWKVNLSTDLNQKVPELAVPVYFLHGVYDRTCSYAEAKAYFENLKAPVKGFYTFDDSAHSPIFEEPAKVQQIIRDDVLKGTNSLADEQ